MVVGRPGAGGQLALFEKRDPLIDGPSDLRLFRLGQLLAVRPRRSPEQKDSKQNDGPCPRRTAQGIDGPHDWSLAKELCVSPGIRRAGTANLNAERWTPGGSRRRLEH